MTSNNNSTTTDEEQEISDTPNPINIALDIPFLDYSSYTLASDCTWLINVSRSNRKNFEAVVASNPVKVAAGKKDDGRNNFVYNFKIADDSGNLTARVRGCRLAKSLLLGMLCRFSSCVTKRVKDSLVLDPLKDQPNGGITPLARMDYTRFRVAPCFDLTSELKKRYKTIDTVNHATLVVPFGDVKYAGWKHT